MARDDLTGARYLRRVGQGLGGPRRSRATCCRVCVVREAVPVGELPHRIGCVRVAGRRGGWEREGAWGPNRAHCSLLAVRGHGVGGARSSLALELLARSGQHALPQRDPVQLAQLAARAGPQGGGGVRGGRGRRPGRTPARRRSSAATTARSARCAVEQLADRIEDHGQVTGGDQGFEAVIGELSQQRKYFVLTHAPGVPVPARDPSFRCCRGGLGCVECLYGCDGGGGIGGEFSRGVLGGRVGGVAAERCPATPPATCSSSTPAGRRSRVPSSGQEWAGWSV